MRVTLDGREDSVDVSGHEKRYQPNLFGAPAAPPAYVVPYPISVNTLTRTLDRLQAAQRWPWDPDMKAARMERNVPKMLAVLTPEEAEVWRARIDAEAARLDAAA